MKQFNLIEALTAIAQDCYIPVEFITSISFEDGSGRKFNFSTTVNGSYYVRLSNSGQVVENTFLNER